MTVWFVQVQDGDDHEVIVYGDEFQCATCGAEGLTDGFLTDAEGAQEWHDSVMGGA